MLRANDQQPPSRRSRSGGRQSSAAIFGTAERWQPPSIRVVHLSSVVCTSGDVYVRISGVCVVLYTSSILRGVFTTNTYLTAGHMLESPTQLTQHTHKLTTWHGNMACLMPTAHKQGESSSLRRTARQTRPFETDTATAVPPATAQTATYERATLGQQQARWASEISSESPSCRSAAAGRSLATGRSSAAGRGTASDRAAR